MGKKLLTPKQALNYLLSGYAVEGEKRTFRLFEGKIQALGEQDRLLLNRYQFLEIFKESTFTLSEENANEELVDPKKDEEYYSFRQ